MSLAGRIRVWWDGRPVRLFVSAADVYPGSFIWTPDWRIPVETLDDLPQGGRYVVMQKPRLRMLWERFWRWVIGDSREDSDGQSPG